MFQHLSLSFITDSRKCGITCVCMYHIFVYISSFVWFLILKVFTPSIAEVLFVNATQFAKRITEISDYDMSLINQSQ